VKEKKNQSLVRIPSKGLPKRKKKKKSSMLVSSCFLIYALERMAGDSVLVTIHIINRIPEPLLQNNTL